jgi:hypothetical protein
MKHITPRHQAKGSTMKHITPRHQALIAAVNRAAGQHRTKEELMRAQRYLDKMEMDLQAAGFTKVK